MGILNRKNIYENKQTQLIRVAGSRNTPAGISTSDRSRISTKAIRTVAAITVRRHSDQIVIVVVIVIVIVIVTVT